MNCILIYGCGMQDFFKIKVFLGMILESETITAILSMKYNFGRNFKNIKNKSTNLDKIIKTNHSTLHRIYIISYYILTLINKKIILFLLTPQSYIKY